MLVGTELAYLKEMGSLNYPFVDTVPSQLEGLIADLVLTLNPVNMPGNYYFYVDAVYMTELTFDAVIKCTNGLVTSTVIDTRDSVPVTSSWGTTPTWKTYQWSPGSILKLVLDTSKLAVYEGVGLNLVLTGSCINIRPPQVNKLVVYTSLTDPPTEYAAVNTRFAAGYNLVIKPNYTEDTALQLGDIQPVQQDSSITFDCIPGSGLGKFPETCTGDRYIRLINNTAADKYGDFKFNPKDCYWLEKVVDLGEIPPATNPREGTIVPGRLRLNNDCKACSTCDDYYNLYQKLVTIHDRAEVIHGRTLSALKYYDYYVKLANLLKGYLDGVNASFSIVKENADLFTAKVTLSTGNHALDMFNAAILFPTGFDVVPKLGSGWKKIGSQGRARPLDDTTSPMTDGTIDYPTTMPVTVYFGDHTISMWQWSFYLKPQAPEVGVTTKSVSFSCAITAHENGGGDLNLGTQIRNTSVKYTG